MDASVATACPVCEGATVSLGTVDFNKSCEEVRGKILPPAGIPIEYFCCRRCAFSFAPQLYQWTLEEFSEKIYNQDYAAVDPDYLDARPRANATHLLRLFPAWSPELGHLDYGGGNGLLSQILLDEGWYSASYDPFVDRDLRLDDFGKFNLITAFEVFEHVPDPVRLVADIDTLIDDDGIVLFSTLLSDGNIGLGRSLDWWYLGPRNGHISLYSTGSLAALGARRGFNFGSFAPNFHAYWKRIPAWAKHLFPNA